MSTVLLLKYIVIKNQRYSSDLYVALESDNHHVDNAAYDMVSTGDICHLTFNVFYIVAHISQNYNGFNKMASVNSDLDISLDSSLGNFL